MWRLSLTLYQLCGCGRSDHLTHSYRYRKRAEQKRSTHQSSGSGRVVSDQPPHHCHTLIKSGDKILIRHHRDWLTIIDTPTKTKKLCRYLDLRKKNANIVCSELNAEHSLSRSLVADLIM
ncbi:hypothetical protein RRG08_008412 [Elysia crispata]|uniref:Uncharacterized protein n=1 Tax=Elysia crispata TaxID=231223 RepID=A0AAE0ZSM5_9GAST|nr:hypothetical protein RRG08_008412 [Elysia crispata]